MLQHHVINPSQPKSFIRICAYLCIQADYDFLWRLNNSDISAW